MRAAIRFRKLQPGEKYQIGDFHRLPGSKVLWPVRSSVGGIADEPRHLETGRVFYRVDMPLHVSAEIIIDKLLHREEFVLDSYASDAAECVGAGDQHL